MKFNLKPPLVHIDPNCYHCHHLISKKCINKCHSCPSYIKTDLKLGIIPQWISVNDKLPILNTDVLVVTKEKQIFEGSHMRVARMYERMLSDFFETEESKKDILRWNTCDTVTHWMELPESPKE